MNRNEKIKRKKKSPGTVGNNLIAPLLILFAVLLFIGLLPVHGEEKIYRSALRLHILAEGDSEEEQADKLAVRDALLERTGEWLKDAKTRDEAAQILEARRDEIIGLSEQVLRERGHENSVTLTVGTERYPERDYDGFCFPAGEYLSVKVVIGEGAGRNWWCCLFPPLCRSTATVGKKEAEEDLREVGLTPDQYKIITETEKPVYRVRFKLLEWLMG